MDVDVPMSGYTTEDWEALLKLNSSRQLTKSIFDYDFGCNDEIIKPHPLIVKHHKELCAYIKSRDALMFSELKPMQVVDVDDVEGYVPRHATPFIQVFSVCVSTNDLDDEMKPCEIYGSICASSQGGLGDDRSFNIYDRGPEAPETVWSKGSLSLVGPQDKPIIPSRNTTLHFSLKDRILGVVVVEGQLNLDPLTEDDDSYYDRLLVGKVESALGSAHVYYAAFQFAVYAIVHVTITEKYDNYNVVDDDDIYGSVVARYENGRRYCSGDEQVKLLETLLFETPPHLPSRGVAGEPIMLFRNVVAVPAYSTLAVEVNLWNSCGKIAGDRLQYPPFFGDPKYIRSEYACVQVKVQWRSSYVLGMEDFLKAKAWEKEKAELLHIEDCSTSLVPSSSSYLGYGEPKTEVFSVFVDGINTEKISALCGTISIDDGESDMFSIYTRDENSFDELSPDNSLASIEVHRAIRDSEFYMKLNLRDPIGKLEVSRGHCGWSEGALETNMLYEKQICSIVRGKDGYAAVHYQVFNSAFQANVGIKLLSNSRCDSPLSLFGTLIARYSGHDYSTNYQKKYFTSRLFARPQNKAVKVSLGRGIEMVKSVVAVPIKSYLIIEADLMVSNINEVDERMRGMVEFKIDLSGTTCQIIRGGNYWVEVSVEFKV